LALRLGVVIADSVSPLFIHSGYVIPGSKCQDRDHIQAGLHSAQNDREEKAIQIGGIDMKTEEKLFEKIVYAALLRSYNTGNPKNDIPKNSVSSRAVDGLVHWYLDDPKP